MWIMLGFGAIIAAMLNLIWFARGKNASIFRFISLSLTALTLCAFYEADAQWVLAEDWGALMDVVPTMSKMLWSLTLTSIALNSISLFKIKRSPES